MKFFNVPFHTVLMSLMPILLLFQANVHEIPPEDIVLPIIFSIIVMGIAWIILRYFLGTTKSALILSLLVFLAVVFCYTRLFFATGGADVTATAADESLLFLGQNLVLAPMFLAVGIFLIIYIIRRKISKEINSVVNAMAVVLVFFVIFQAMLYYSSEDIVNSSLFPLVEVPIFQSNVTEKPDVYLILLDAYSGDTTLKKDYGFDNSEFKNKLKERGFFVPKNSFSNYPNTELSMPSIMNMMYLDNFTDVMGIDSKDKLALIELRQENNVMNIFQANEYHITTYYGGIYVEGKYQDNYDTICGAYFDLNADLQRSFVQTYFPTSSLRTMFFDDFRHNDLECAVSEFINFEKKNERPQFVYAHLYLPHPPFTYDAEGNHIQDTFAENRFDSILKDAYLQQTIFTNKKAIELVDSIQKRDSNAVIIVMSDHGGRLGVDWYDPTDFDYYRTFENLSAFYFPGQEENMPKEIAAVNVFRTLFNLYLDADYEILEDKQMWYVSERPYDQIDVTDKLRK